MVYANFPREDSMLTSWSKGNKYPLVLTTRLRKLHLLENRQISCMASTQIMEVKGELTTRLTIGFRVLPNYGNDLRRQYNQLLAEVSRSDLLSFLVSQIVKRRITVTKLDPDMFDDILETNYSLS